MKVLVVDKWDIGQIHSIIRVIDEFIKETQFPITFDFNKAYGGLQNAFFNPEGAIIVATTDGGEIMGGAIVYATADWQVEKFGYLEKLFIRSKFRSEGVGRALAQKVAEWFDANECLFSFATSTANIGEARLFENLMAKFGYQNLGPTLSRKYHGKI